MTSPLQAVLNRILADRRLQREFLWNPFVVLDGAGLGPNDVRELLFWLPLRLALATADHPETVPPPRFRDRADAGRRLAQLLQPWRNAHPIVLALPRGGVMVGYEAARGLDAPLDVLVARKLGAPGNPEFAFGAIAPGGIEVMDERAVRLLGLTQDEIGRIRDAEQVELQRRERRFRGDGSSLHLSGRTIVLVDDGLSSGLTARAAVASLRTRQPQAIVLAVPACPSAVAADMRPLVDGFVCIAASQELHPVVDWYEEYPQVTNAEVVILLEAARREGISHLEGQ